jgi:hypothetical protein
MKRACILFAFLLPAVAVAGQENATLAERPSIEVFRVDEPPELDGRLDDAAWQTAAKLTEFTQQTPREGEPATEETEVWIAYDSDHLYLAVHAHYSDVSLMRANRSRRDQTWNDDRVLFYFDTFFDQQSAYQFSVNGYGVQSDAIRGGGRGFSGVPGGGGGVGGVGGGGGSGGEDSSWNALFDTSGGPVEDGWIVEVAIPFKSLRYPSRPAGEPHRWGLQVLRDIKSKVESAAWSPIARDNPAFLTQMGVLYGMTGLSTSRNMEILPTMTAAQIGSLDGDTGVYSDGNVDPDFGVNFKYGITSNLTADFTLNPDFSQIESDRPQIEVNQRFPLFYPEQRPFFLEGKEVFDTEINLVHTRTIVDPQVGGKLTGKAGNTTFGVLVANDEAPGHVDDPRDPAYGQKAKVAIARVRKDVYAESFIGAIVADREFLDSYSRSFGVDGNFRLGQIYRFNFMVSGSDYRELAEYGSDDEVQEGFGTAIQAAFRRQGRHWFFNSRYTDYSPDFYTDTGFIRRNDMREGLFFTRYTFWPEATLISWGPHARVARNYDHAGVLQDQSAQVGVITRFARNVAFRVQMNRDLERYGDIDFRKSFYEVRGEADFSTKLSLSGRLIWGDAIRYGDNPFLGRERRGNVRVTARPTSRLEAEFTTDFTYFRDERAVSEVEKDDFSIEIHRLKATYQFTDRFQFRNILEYNSYRGTFGANLLLSYEVNAGTVFFLGYDGRYEEALNINDEIYDTDRMLRTSRAFFMKIAYLFRY